MSISIRRALVPASFLFVLGAVASSSSVWNQDPAQVDLEIAPVTGPVSVLYGRGGNIGISNGPDGLLVIDSQFEWLAPKIETALQELAGEGASFLVNTHVHGDHTGGNAVLGKFGTIVAHTNTRGRLISEAGGATDTVKGKLPTITFDESLSVHFNGEEVQLIHLAGSHTDTDVAVWFTDSKVLHTGDLFFASGFPFVDTGRGGNVDGLIASVEQLLAKIPSDAKIIPGHGEVCGPAEFGAYLEMLIECRDRVAEALAAEKSLEEMVAMKLLGDLDPIWGTGFINADRFLAAIVTSISTK